MGGGATGTSTSTGGGDDGTLVTTDKGSVQGALVGRSPCAGSGAPAPMSALTKFSQLRIDTEGDPWFADQKSQRFTSARARSSTGYTV